MKTYQDEPNNIEDIRRFCIHEKQDVITKTLTAKALFIYDTCSIMHHANAQNIESISNYIKVHMGTVLITKTVLLELSSSDNHGNILEKNINFLKQLSDYGIDIIIFEEELCYDCIKFSYSYNVDEINEQLKYSIRFIKRFQGTIAQYIDSLLQKDRIALLNGESDREEITQFFAKIRKTKKSQDSLAEELIFLMIILLQGIINEVIFVSDDFRSSDKFLQLTDYIQEHYNRKGIYVYTTAVLFYKSVRENIINSEEGKSLLECTYRDKIKMYATDKHDLKIKKKELSIEEFIKIINEDSEFRIYR